ncbi:MAG: DNA polymerase III subunit gamma/tau [Thalassobaculum sp.]|uniref:DNA polymerase III subunit gamma/tau n=1 Tax=Thalassobaculum sp. TaxID=2022740 RepID=UPI0032F02B99
MSDAGTPADSPAAEYRVLARKYRPQTFEDLVGQETLVRTLRNAFAQNRIHHAFVLTGVRGVGKTTTARIVAKGLNCTGPDGSGGPTMTPCGVCENCRAIAEDRHVDVLEMDAASRTGVDDVREIIESVRYRPVSARYKVYIVDEVHMLTRNAFNALLKTLEEPPEHVKFIFATTEIRKVPITVLSRCQRFDLRRIDVAVLTGLFERVCAAEGVEAEAEALRMIARAADGSARDGLSILDQAMALATGPVTAAQVRDMLGLVDRERVYDLFEAVMAGRIPDALDVLRMLYDGGADPVVVIQDLMELTHAVTRMKAAPKAAGANDLGEAERDRGRRLAETLAVPALTRSWQMLSKGLGEVQNATAPVAAAEMVLIRLGYAAELPDPADLIRLLTDGSGAVAGGSAAQSGSGQAAAAPVASAVPPRPGAPEPAPVGPPPVDPDEPPAYVTDGPPPDGVDEEQPPAMPATFREMVELFHARGEPVLSAQLAGSVHCVSYAPGRVDLRPQAGADPRLTAQLSAHLGRWTGQSWDIRISRDAGEPTLREQAGMARAERFARVAEHPVVSRVLDLFPGARIEEITAPPPADPVGEADEDEAMDDADTVVLDDEGSGGGHPESKANQA